MGHKILEKTKSSNKTDPKITNSKSEQQLENLIDFYKQPEFMQMISQQLAGQTNIDFTKIEKIKQAIDDNTLSIDYKDLAEKIISFESELEISKNKN